MFQDLVWPVSIIVMLFSYQVNYVDDVGYCCLTQGTSNHCHGHVLELAYNQTSPGMRDIFLKQLDTAVQKTKGNHSTICPLKRKNHNPQYWENDRRKREGTD